MTCATSRLVLGALLLTSSACGETLEDADLAALPSIAGYADWMRYETQGFAPGHQESFRRIYVNAAATSRTAGAPFPPGSVIVKEIYELGGTRDNPAPGALRYTALMRRPAAERPGLTFDGGWLFTNRDLEGREKRVSTCWSTCHQQAPYEGVFLDYGASRPSR